MLATLWQGCYQDTWQDSIVPEAFSHPAKFSRGLIHRIYRHLMEQGHIAAGTTALDPFGGVALGALDAMTYGLNWLGVELEPKFVALGKKNLELWRQRYGFRQGTLVQGDSRRLRDILLPYSGVQAVVGSPPWGHSQEGASVAGPSSGMWKGYDGPIYASSEEHYGQSPGQLGAMPPGAVVSSPPFLETAGGGKVPRNGWTTEGGMAHQRAASTEPYRSRMTREADHDTFWSAAAQIMQELTLLLPAGAVCAWVVKAYVKNKQIVPFPDQWLALCEQHGFRLVEEIRASLVEDHGTQEGLFGEAQRVTTEKKSFFRRLAEKKGSPRIDHETVLIVHKAGDGGGMCCVSSPPFCQSDNRGDRASFDRLQEAVVRDGNGHGGKLGPSIGQSYGTTPGNLGNLPVGRP